MKIIKRRKTKIINIGNKKIGGKNHILIQSMTNVPTLDIKKTVSQIKKLEKSGCEIVRIGLPDLKSAQNISKIKRQIKIPLVADIHFSADIALEAINQGADKIRINPGNFPKNRLKEIANKANQKKIPIRIGINSGSLEKDLINNHKSVNAEMMVMSALKNIKLMEKLNFYNLVISLKSSDVLKTIKAYQILSKKVNYPLHLGITEAGSEFSGTIKSSIGIGSLLLKGIGDTIRVSLTADPVKEIEVGWQILKSLEIRERGVKIISCPTCARTEINVIKLSQEIEKQTKAIEKPLKIAIMGCVVNGLGESKEADLAIVGVKKDVLIISKGKILNKTKEKNALKEFIKELKNLKH